MFRVLIILVILFIVYLVIRNAWRGLNQTGSSSTALSNSHMIQDPVCRVYVPMGEAVEERIGGHTYYFCSPACAKTFQKQLAG